MVGAGEEQPNASSTIGETSKNISAPGTNIYSTYPSGYGVMSGTSMAAPHVAGVVGLMFAVNPMMSATQAKDLLYASARDLGDEGRDETGIPEGADYTLKGDVTEIDADEYLATAVVKGKVNTCWEDYSTSCRIAWSIEKRPASEVSVTVPGSYVYDGSAHTPKPTVTWICA